MAVNIEELNIKGVKIPIIFENSKNLPIISMRIVFKNSGYIYDGSKAGLCNFLSEVLDEGTLEDGSITFAKKLESKAISISSSCGAETFVFKISSLKEIFPKAVRYFNELVSSPNFEEKTLAKIKVKIKGNILRKESDFDYQAFLGLKKILFNKTPLARASLGTKDDIDKINIQDLEKLFLSNFTLNKAVIVIGGDLSKKEAKEYSKEILSTFKEGEELKKIDFYEVLSKNKEDYIKKDTKQAYIYFGSAYKQKVDSKDNYKSKLAMFILGSSGFGSRLMEEIRVKKGLAYSVYSSASINKSHSYFTGYLQTNLKNQEKAKKLLKEIISDFIKNGAKKEELKAAKNFILGSEPLRNETLSQRLKRAFSEYYYGKKIGFYKEELAKIKDLNLKDLNAFIKTKKEILDLNFFILSK